MIVTYQDKTNVFSSIERDPARDLKCNICHITNPTVYEIRVKMVEKILFENFRVLFRSPIYDPKVVATAFGSNIGVKLGLKKCHNFFSF